PRPGTGRGMNPVRDDAATTPCAVCARPFEPDGRQPFCSTSCRKKAWRHQRPLQRRPARQRPVRQTEPEEVINPTLLPGRTPRPKTSSTTLDDISGDRPGSHSFGAEVEFELLFALDGFDAADHGVDVVPFGVTQTVVAGGVEAGVELALDGIDGGVDMVDGDGVGVVGGHPGLTGVELDEVGVAEGEGHDLVDGIGGPGDAFGGGGLGDGPADFA